MKKINFTFHDLGFTRKSVFSGVCAATLMLGAFDMAQAATFSVSSLTGQWTSANPTGVSGVGSNTISWGTPATTAGKSSYVFAGTAPAGKLAMDSLFNVGTFTHNNNPITGISLGKAQLKISLGLTIFDGNKTENKTIDSVFDFTHWETPNTPPRGSQCPGGTDQNGCFDRVTFTSNPAQTGTFKVGDTEYSFNLTGFLIGGEPATEFWTKEKKSNTATLQASITSTPPAVPIPAAAWLFGSALIGLVGIARRRKSVQV